MYVCKVVAEALMSVFRIFGTETLNPIFYKLGLLASKLWVFLFSCYCTLNPIFYKSWLLASKLWVFFFLVIVLPSYTHTHTHTHIYILYYNF